MAVNSKVNDIVKKVLDGELIDQDEIKMLLQLEPHSIDAGFVIAASDSLNRIASTNRAEVHAQIGLNCSPCPRNCSFCAFADKNKVFTEDNELSLEDVILMAKNAEIEGANASFDMATGDHPIQKFIMANCTHEPNLLGANSGANLFWAEVGTNPRDTEEDTSKGRGLDVYSCKNYFKESDYTVVEGPSIFYSEANKI